MENCVALQASADVSVVVANKKFKKVCSKGGWFQAGTFAHILGECQAEFKPAVMSRIRPNGDKPEIHGSSKGKSSLITLILKEIDAEYSHLLKVPCSDIAKTIQKLGQLHAVRSYTNFYGNIKGAMTQEDFSFIFSFDGYVIQLLPLDKCEAAWHSKLISDEDWTLCQSIHAKHRANEEQMRKWNPHLNQ